jgi:hypothetical protein
MKKLLIIILVILSAEVASYGQEAYDRAPKKSEKGLFSKIHIFGGNKKKMTPGSAADAKKRQAEIKKKEDKEWAKSVKASQKRTYDIQTPDVQARMKQNKKDATMRDKAQKKRVRQNSRKAGRKS